MGAMRMASASDRVSAETKRPDLATGPLGSTGAGEEIRTLDPNLGKLTQPGAQKQKSPILRPGSFKTTGAGEEIRTLDPNLGKVVLYH